MGHLLYLMFRCDFDVMESLESLDELRELNTTPADTSKLQPVAQQCD